MNGIYAGINGNSILKLIVTLIIFILILFITYYVTSFIGNIQKTQFATGNIQIIEVRRIMGNKQLAVVKTGNDYFLVGIGKDEINLIGKVDGEALVLNEEPQTPAFGEILDKIKNIREKKK